MTGKKLLKLLDYCHLKKIKYYFSKLNQYFRAHFIYVNINLGLVFNTLLFAYVSCF